MADIHTRTIPLHVAVCRSCGQTKQSTDADHVADWITAHRASPCVARPVVPIPDREWED